MTPAQPTRKDSAEFLRLGLLTGICELSEVAAWADTIILAEPSPPFVYLELSTCTHGPVSSALSLLAKIPGTQTPELAANLLVGRAWALHHASAFQLSDLQRRLTRLATGDNLPDRLSTDLLWIYEDVICAEEKIYGTIAEAERRFAEYLAAFEAYASSR